MHHLPVLRNTFQLIDQDRKTGVNRYFLKILQCVTVARPQDTPIRMPFAVKDLIFVINHANKIIT